MTHFKSQFGGELQMLLVLDAPRSLYYRLGERGAERPLSEVRAAVGRSRASRSDVDEEAPR